MQKVQAVKNQADPSPAYPMQYWFVLLAWFSIAVYSADTIYRSIYGITYETRQNCILYRNTPKWFFMLYENVLELFIVVTIGVVIAALVEKYFKRIHPVFPDNPVIAFIYASILPVCSCTAIPLVKAMHENISYRTIITFLISAPLLNPYIIMITYKTLGLEYMLVRIAASFIMAYGASLVMEKLLEKPEVAILPLPCATKRGCAHRDDSIWENAKSVFIQVLPYILLAGGLSLAFEFLSPKKLVELIPIDNGIISTLAMVALGIPIYLCNGADALVLKPLAEYTDIGFGTALSFSLTSSSICIASIILLTKFIGVRHTVMLTFLIFISAVVLGTLLNHLPMFSL